jgi:hypothetical protein
VLSTPHTLYILTVSVQPSGQMRKWIIGVIVILALTGTLYYFFPEDKLPTDKKIEKLIVTKSKRTMDVYSGGQIIKTYAISLG